MTSRFKKRFLIAAGLVAALTLCVLTLLPLLFRPTNCGGNSAALAACHGYVKILQLWTAGHKGQSFRFELAGEETRRHLSELVGSPWLRSARLLAKLDNVRVDPAFEKSIIMVCDRAYDNVPERIFGRSPMAHAVAYSTGEIGLISPEDFARLDLEGFIDLQALTAVRRDP